MLTPAEGVRSIALHGRGEGSVCCLFLGVVVGEEAVFGDSFLHRTALKKIFA